MPLRYRRWIVWTGLPLIAVLAVIVAVALDSSGSTERSIVEDARLLGLDCSPDDDLVSPRLDALAGRRGEGPTTAQDAAVAVIERQFVGVSNDALEPLSEDDDSARIGVRDGSDVKVVLKMQKLDDRWGLIGYHACSAFAERHIRRHSGDAETG